MSTQPESPAHYDIAVIGGGPAGLSAAVSATRLMQRTIVVEAPSPPRNAVSRGAHGLLGLDTRTPDEVRAAVWGDLRRYGLATLRSAEVTDLARDPDGGFRITASGDDGADERVWARHVVLATGVVDDHPKIPGFAECWGRSVIHCPFCVGWENRDRAWGLVHHDPDHAITAARAFRAWSGDILAIVPPDIARLDEVRAAYEAAERELVEGRVARLHHRGGELHTVELDDGRTLPRQTLLWHLTQRQVPLIGRLVASLGLAVDEGGFVTVDASRETNIPGLYAAGDLTVPMGQNALDATATGGAAATAIGRKQMFGG
ncbi:NAD(P)/FAD-dependent oxidoreductase [Yinghuangia sp. ASG 101]|uniref:NAD(P)/FAD-dependent oxidoreductase n=1 Tax=Yinghuangia sp. ASG 101 TaxID=2896848 RepID=UPI001E3B0314|nr:NAD(P)/FAD-dependent oxidoreductase [Yinghuangia sp. ASG 101]UGQ13107.1 NAD(P)/FAD-dependent oxidoreductase [Yinghuangia sp. ASG 101]